MKPATIQSMIKSIPKTLAYIAPDGTATPKQIYVEDARHARVDDHLKTAPIVLTFRFMDDRTSAATPTNRLLAVRIPEEGDIVETRGEMTNITLSLNLFARAGGEPPGEDLVDQAADALILWSLRDLPRAVTARERGPVHDLSYLEEGRARRQMDVIIEVPTAYPVALRTIEEIDHTLSVQ